MSSQRPAEAQPGRGAEHSGARRSVVIVAARDEADRITATLEALKRAFPGARLVVADDGSRDATSALASEAGAELASRLPGAGRPSGERRRGRGKGGAVTAAARSLLGGGEAGGNAAVPSTVVLCDGDLGDSARELWKLAEAVESGECDLAVAAFARSEGGGFGVTLGFARWVIESLTGVRLRAPISGQRALRGDLLPSLLPFAPGFGIETAMSVDALRAGARLEEIELDLQHRATGRTLSGFLHRGRQLRDIVLVYLSRRLRHRRR